MTQRKVIFYLTIKFFKRTEPKTFQSTLDQTQVKFSIQLLSIAKAPKLKTLLRNLSKSNSRFHLKLKSSFHRHRLRCIVNLQVWNLTRQSHLKNVNLSFQWRLKKRSRDWRIFCIRLSLKNLRIMTLCTTWTYLTEKLVVIHQAAAPTTDTTTKTANTYGEKATTSHFDSRSNDNSAKAASE